MKKLILNGNNCCDEFEWEDLCENLTVLMNDVNPTGYWKAKVKNFGWDNTNGTMDTFYCDNGRTLLRKILPNTECSFKVYKHGETGIAIDNAHHDKPCGGEWYYILKTEEE